MQPYFFPYIGYFQLLNVVDKFVIYDIIEYSKGGWINRNRILINGRDSYITLPLKKDSDFLFIKDRQLANTWDEDRIKMTNKIIEAYRKAPFFEKVFPLIESCLYFGDGNLFNFIFNSINTIKNYLEIKTPCIAVSEIDIDHTLKSQNKIVRICHTLKADRYINPIGGIELYKNEYFEENGVKLQFLKTKDINYKQFSNEFVHSLSIIDVLMFNSRDVVQEMIERNFVVLNAE